MRKLLVAVVLSALAGIGNAAAQAYPSRPITMIVPFAAGGITDIVARLVSERMKTSLGQPVIAENVAGAGGTIGVTRLFRSAPDGHTLAIGQWTSHVGAGAMYSLPFDYTAGFRAGVDAVDRPALDHRAQGSAGKGFARADCVAQGQSGQGVGRHHRSRQRGAYVPRLFPEHDRHQLPVRALSGRRAGDAGSARRADRPVLSRGRANAVAISRRQHQGLRGADAESAGSRRPTCR